MEQTERQVISREQAHAEGRLRFFTAKPCKRGHVAERYVSTNACVECLGKTFKFRKNPWSAELAPFNVSTLWVAATLTPEERDQLAVYLQQCIFQFIKVKGKMSEGVLQAANHQMAKYGIQFTADSVSTK